MDEKLVTNGTELPAGAELSVEAGLPVKSVLPDETGLPALTEFVSHSYVYLSNKFQNSIISEFKGIVFELNFNAWLGFLFLFIVATICYFIYLKSIANKKTILSNKNSYIKIDNLYKNIDGFLTFIFYCSFAFVIYAYSTTGHEIKYLGSIILGTLVYFIASIVPCFIRHLLVIRWKNETLKLLESSSFTVFDDYNTQEKQYTWKNKSAKKSYFLFLEKTSASQKILENELDHYKKGLHKDKVTDTYLDQAKTVIIHVDSKEESAKPVKETITLVEQPIKSVAQWTIANHFYFWIVTIIALTVAWKAGGWWWFFAFLIMGGVKNHIEEKEKPKDADAMNKPINEDIKSRTPALSVLAEKKITNPSDPLPQNNSNIKIEPKPKESSSALGVWTFIAFVIAFFAGGWWWVLAIIMGLIWLGNKGENKQENASAQSTAPVINTNIPTNNLSGWAKQLTDICAQYSGNDYFVAELIPAQKLENAMKQYPMPGLVITLIDATLFGSADNGMLIGKKGISWRNKVVVGKSDLCWHDGLYNGNRFTLMTWKYFSKQKIKLENTNIRVGSDNIFDMSGCQFDKTKIIALLNAIQQAYLLQDSSQPLAQTSDVSKNVPQKQKQKYEDVRTVTWVERLTNACLQYSANGFYVGELLPEKNLQHAMKDYPTPDNGKIVALVDTSAFGSIQGMAIGEHGVSWLNRLSHSYSCYWWKDFSKKVISLEDGLLKIGKSGSFELIGDSQQNKTLVAFLQNIQRVYLEQENEYKHPEDIIDQVLSQDSKEQQGINISSDISRQSDSIKVTDNLIDLNTADLDTLLALPGIGVAEAKSLIKQRDVAGPFTSTKQVFDFLNLKPHHANQWKDRVVINETISPQTSTITATPNPEIHRPLGGRTID